MTADSMENRGEFVSSMAASCLSAVTDRMAVGMTGGKMNNRFHHFKLRPPKKPDPCRNTVAADTQTDVSKPWRDNRAGGSEAKELWDPQVPSWQ